MHSVFTDIMPYMTVCARMVVALRTRHSTAANLKQVAIRFDHAAACAYLREIRFFPASSSLDVREKQQVYKLRRR